MGSPLLIRKSNGESSIDTPNERVKERRYIAHDTQTRYRDAIATLSLAINYIYFIYLLDAIVIYLLLPFTVPLVTPFQFSLHFPTHFLSRTRDLLL